MKGILKYAAFLFVIYHLTNNFDVVQVEGASMQPTIDDKEFCLVQMNQDIVIINSSGFSNYELIIKRITGIENNLIYVEGDNKSNSFDSDTFGWIDKELVYGKLLYHFAGISQR